MIQILRGTDARLSASSAPTPKHGQPVYSTDTYNLKIGDGNHKFDELPTPNMIPSIKKNHIFVHNFNYHHGRTEA